MYVKKLTSQNPTKYKYLKIDKAFDQYSIYLISVIRIGHHRTELKTFKQWLLTEM